MADDVKRTGEAEEAALEFGKQEFVVPQTGQTGQIGTPAALDTSAQATSAQATLAQATLAQATSADLVSPGIHDDLMKKKITGLSVPEADAYEPGSYIIDTTECQDGMTIQTCEALRLMFKENGSIAVYTMTKTATFMIGRVEPYTAYAILSRMIPILFGSKVKLYHLEDTKEFKRVDRIKLTDVRLDL